MLKLWDESRKSHCVEIRLWNTLHFFAIIQCLMHTLNFEHCSLDQIPQLLTCVVFDCEICGEVMSPAYISRLVLLTCSIDLALAFRAEVYSNLTMPDCAEWYAGLPGKIFGFRERKNYLNAHPDPCAASGLECCKGKCGLKGCETDPCSWLRINMFQNVSCLCTDMHWT